MSLSIIASNMQFILHHVLGLIILGIVLDLGGGPNHDRLGFRYWKHPGAFAQFNGIDGAKGRFLGWWAVMTQAAFAFLGTEIVAVSKQNLIFSSGNCLTFIVADCRRRGKESSSQLTQSHTSCLHPYSTVLSWRCHHYRSPRSLE